MATLEDKILGDKLENYCSSSEDEGGYEDASDGEASEGGSAQKGGAAAAGGPAPQYSDIESWSGSSANTGPKGVIKDWQRFKQLENEKNAEKEQERLMLLKKLSITTQTKAEELKQREQDELDAEMAELMNEDTLLIFQKQRMLEMLQNCGYKKQNFGKVVSLQNGDEFLSAVDNEEKTTTVIVHIYENNLAACKTMNRCLDKLAAEYLHVKFCKIFGSVAGMSKDFKIAGIPALLVYKGGNLIGNFVRVSDDLGGDEFFPSDVESFLIEAGMLPDKSHIPIIVNSNNISDDDD